ncbi:nuclear transport factor 2 family protein, partial [Vibrio antiquarius]|uniref:nuclear transport factor 2 family protein n=1 Tax=Vibrio antiquarius (strain Ex25) TaxID=150340 RepID=UPI00265974FD
MEISKSTVVARAISDATPSSTESFDVEVIKSIDASWERALNEGARSVVENLLHHDFVWVHNQAEMIQHSKSDFLEFFDTAFLSSVQRSASTRTGTRNQRHVKVLTHSETAVVYGFTDVKRAGGSVTELDTRPLLVFHFMRTYVKSPNGYLLLANH